MLWRLFISQQALRKARDRTRNRFFQDLSPGSHECLLDIRVSEISSNRHMRITFHPSKAKYVSEPLQNEMAKRKSADFMFLKSPKL